MATKAGFLSKKSGFMMMDTDTSNGFGSDKGSTTQRSVVVDGSSSGHGYCGLGLQPFSTTTSSNNTSSSVFKSPVGMAAACLRYPFTNAQWQELERQALIFKYMMASIPVPPDLLIPITRSLLNTASAATLVGRGSCFNLRFSNGADPEPGRCRRTDGKKWRCSRDVAPDQKYCERHMHRSRPRSRKHVEVHTDINSSPIASSSVPPTAFSVNTTSHQLGSSARPYPQPSFLPKPDFKSLPLETMVTAAPYNKDSRCMDWMLKGDNGPISNQDLQQFMQGKGASTRNNNTLYQQHYQENNSLSSYADFGTSFQGLEPRHQSDNNCFFLNPELASISDQRQTPRRFIDAWSTARDNPTGTDKSSGNGSGKLSPSTLSLSMSSDNGAGEDVDQIQMGLGVMDSECDNTGGNKSQPLRWMTPVPWMASAPGGPLGEVLQSSTTTSQVGSGSANPIGICNTVSRSSDSGGGLNLMTDDWGGSRDTSPRATTANSSPSGVLHKTLTSPSDSSGGNSPTLKAAASRTDIALQWMSK